MSSETFLSPSNLSVCDTVILTSEPHLYSGNAEMQRQLMPPPSSREGEALGTIPWSPTPTAASRASIVPSTPLRTPSRAPSVASTSSISARDTFTTDIMIERLMNAAILHLPVLRNGSGGKHYEAIANHLATEYGVPVSNSTISRNLDKLVLERKAAIAVSDQSGKELAFGNAEQAIDNWITCLEQLAQDKDEANLAKDVLTKLQQERDEARQSFTLTQRQKKRRRRGPFPTGNEALSPIDVDLLESDTQASDSSATQDSRPSHRRHAARSFEASFDRYIELQAEVYNQTQRNDREIRSELRDVKEQLSVIIDKLGRIGN